MPGQVYNCEGKNRVELALTQLFIQALVRSGPEIRNESDRARWARNTSSCHPYAKPLFERPVNNKVVSVLATSTLVMCCI